MTNDELQQAVGANTAAITRISQPVDALVVQFARLPISKRQQTTSD